MDRTAWRLRAVDPPAEAVVTARRQARTVPSLILRLERLAPDAPRTRQPVPEDGHAARSGTVVDLATGTQSQTPLGRWSAAVAAAQDGCLVLDPQGHVVSISASAAELLDCSDVGVIGRPLLDVAAFIDFDTAEPTPAYAPRVPPLAALSRREIARSLIRLRHRDDTQLTLDVCAVPLHDATGDLVGSISFLRRLAD